MGIPLAAVAISGAAVILSIVLLALGGGVIALGLALVHLLTIAGLVPVLYRRIAWHNSVPGPADIACAAASLGMAVAALMFMRDVMTLVAMFVQTVPTVRLAVTPMKIKGAPPWLKKSAIGVLAGLVVVVGTIGVLRGPAVLQGMSTMYEGPQPPPPGVIPPGPPPGAPVATVAGRPVTGEMVQLQIQIDRAKDAELPADVAGAVAALLQSYVALAVLEQKFGGLEKGALKAERNFMESKIHDRTLLTKIKRMTSDELFLDVYVGANGLYQSRLYAAYERTQREELRKRAEAAIVALRKKDGVETDVDKTAGAVAEEMCYLASRREFISPYEADLVPDDGPDPKDALGRDLEKLKVHETLGRVIVGDRAFTVVRRMEDDFRKRRRAYRVIRFEADTDYDDWFRRISADCPIVIPDPVLRERVLPKATRVNHLIKK